MQHRQPRAKSANLWFSPASPPSPLSSPQRADGHTEIYLQELLRKNAAQTLSVRQEVTRVTAASLT